MATQQLSDLDFNSVSRITNLPDGTAPQHPATVAQLNAAVEGLAWKDSVRVATQGNLSVASPGATIDGITMATNDRILVRAQTTATENGLYIWNGAATPATRSLDANVFAELEQAVVTVEEGTSAGSTFRQTAVNGVLGTNDVTWTSFGTSAPAASETTAGVAEIATQTETNTGTDDARFVTPLKLASYSNRKLKFSQTIGDGSATQFTLTHNLGTQDVHVTVYRNSGAFDAVGCDRENTTTNTCIVRFASAPTSNQFRAVVLG
ncbi:MAG: hypothetical protein ACT4QA_22655 [Panacagrimonas sp.]